MDKDLAGGKIGAVGAYDLAFVGGKIVVTASAGLPEAQVAVSLTVSPKSILEVIAAKVGGPIPAEVAAFLETALGLN